MASPHFIAFLCYGAAQVESNALSFVEIWPVDQHPYFGVTDLENLAMVHTMVGELDLELDTTDTVPSMPDLISILLLECDPRWSPLWKDPRFDKLKAKYRGTSDGR